MTHEEVMTEIARKELRSYKQLPKSGIRSKANFAMKAPKPVCCECGNSS